uniref:Ankyrin repeat and SOCS box containing 13 n=1 Tax=Junco hyemalis TaxID=40217 RepID=A0A8C5NTJ2_JUNHY
MPVWENIPIWEKISIWEKNTHLGEYTNLGENIHLRENIHLGECINLGEYTIPIGFPVFPVAIPSSHCPFPVPIAHSQFPLPIPVPIGFPVFPIGFPVFPLPIPVPTGFPAGSPECVQLLIEVGANLEAHDCHFGTPLHVACARGHLDCAKLLLQAGANVNAAKLHETALHHAAKVRSVDLLELLVEFGGNIYARDNRGKKPSDYTWSSSPAAQCCEFYEKTPLSLLQLCRLSVRRAAGRRGLPNIAQLQIPPRLIRYLCYN